MKLADLINHIVAAHPTNKDTKSFDFYNQENHCPYCSGRRGIEKFDIDVVIQDKTVPFLGWYVAPRCHGSIKVLSISKIGIPF